MFSIVVMCFAGAIGRPDGAPTKAPIEIVYRVDVDGSATNPNRSIEIARDVVERRALRASRKTDFVITASTRVELRDERRLVVTATGIDPDAAFLDEVREFVASAVGAEFRIVIPEDRFDADERIAKERLAKRFAATGAQIEALVSEDFRVPRSRSGEGVSHRFVALASDVQNDDATRAFPFVLIEDDPARSFGSADLARSYPTPDARGNTGIGFELRADRASAFGEFTRAHLHDRLAIVAAGCVVSMPTLQGAIADHGIIEGGSNGFRPENLRRLEAWMQPGALPREVHLTEIH